MSRSSCGGVRARVQLARVEVEPVRLLLAALDVEDQLPRRLAHRELRERAHVGPGDDRLAVAVDVSSDSPSVSRAGRPASSSSVGTRSTVRTCDSTTAGLEAPGAERISGTSTISSKSVAPCMW